jgi:hypothetical protein
MDRRWIGLCLFGLAALLPQRAAMAEEPKADARGAVLCAWMIYTEIEAVGETCSPQQDRDFLVFLQSQIDRIKAFIVRNSDTTQAALEEQQRQVRASAAHRSSVSCQPDGDSMQMYKAIKSVDRRQIIADMDNLLEVDREPVANPCL